MRMRMEVVAMFWVGDNPKRAELAANAVSPLFADEKPGQPMVTVTKDGQVMLGFMTEIDTRDDTP